jgi:hypothetical protein
LKTVDNSASIKITKPTINDLVATMNDYVPRTSYQPLVTIISSTNVKLVIEDIRYAFYIYKYNGDITPKSKLLLCSGKGYLESNAKIPISCLIPTINEGDRLHVAVLANH